MKSIHNIIHRSIVVPFYKQIAGAIYLLFFILFGIQPNFKQALDTHYYIILSILDNNTAFLLYAAICVLYSCKCIMFYNNRIGKQEYFFLQILNGTKQIIRLRAFLWAAIKLSLPIFLYTFCIVVVAISENRLTRIWPSILLIICLISFITYAIYYVTQKPTSLTSSYSLNIKKQPATLWWFTLKYIFREQFWALFILKLINFCCIYFLVIQDASVFDNRILWLIFLLCLVGHCVIIYKNFYFIENKLAFYRSLPLQSIIILASIFLLYTILLIPEFWALRAIAVTHQNVGEYICMLILSPAILTLLHVLLYTDDLKMDGYLSLVFLVWMVFFFFSFAQKTWLLPAISITGCIIVFYTSYRKFEKNPEIEKLE